MNITSEEAHDYFDRWSQVRAREILELRKTSMGTKLRQLAALMESGHVFANDPLREAQIDLARSR